MIRILLIFLFSFPVLAATPKTTSVREAPVREDIMKVAREFESLLTNQMLSVMRKTVSRGGIVPQSQGEKVYQSMLDYEYAKTISNTGQMGLANMVYQQLLAASGGG